MPYPTTIRLPDDVRRVLRQAAKQNRRTVTQQINYVLQEWIKRDYPPKAGKPKGELTVEEPQSGG
jgi:hypothetical protein